MQYEPNTKAIQIKMNYANQQTDMQLNSLNWEQEKKSAEKLPSVHNKKDLLMKMAFQSALVCKLDWPMTNIRPHNDVESTTLQIRFWRAPEMIKSSLKSNYLYDTVRMCG